MPFYGFYDIKIILYYELKYREKMSPAIKENVENVTDASSQTNSVISETENIPRPGNERSAMYLEDVFYDDIVDVTLRRAPGTHFLISVCGRFVMNDKFPHITKIYHATDKVRETYTYFNIERIKIHRLVGRVGIQSSTRCFNLSRSYRRR